MKPEQKKHKHTFHPPRLATWILYRILAWRAAEMAADLEDLFQMRVQESDVRRARRLYWRDVVSICRRHRLRRRKLFNTSFPYQKARGPFMLKNYFKIALRNLWKHKGYSFINIGGLAIGMAGCILILLFVQDELSYDAYHEKSDRIYRIALEMLSPGEPEKYFANTALALAPALEEDFPAVEHAVRFRRRSFYVERGTSRFYENRFLFSDPEVFDIFSFPLVAGDPKTALTEPFSVVLTQESAEKYFGDEEALGQVLTMQDTLAFQVTGVMASLPTNNHIRFDFLASFETLIAGQQNLNQWWNHSYYTYVLLQESASLEDFKPQLYDVTRQHIAEQEDLYGFQQKHYLQPLSEIYLHSDIRGEGGPRGSITYVYTFSAIAVLILLIACINFMNLATARSMQRAREVGMRKVLGAYRQQLAGQFLGESFLVAIVAMVLAVGFVIPALPLFNSLSGKALSVISLQNSIVIWGLLGITLVVGLASGSYPAFALSSFRPVEVLKGALNGAAGAGLRKMLVVFQFGISIVLIVGTLVVYQQLDFMQNQQLGFAKEQILIVPTRGISDFDNTYESIKEQFLQQGDVLGISASSSIPGRGLNNIVIQPEGMTDNETRTMLTLGIDHDFVETYGLELAAGRSFSQAFSTDEGEGFILNEAAVADVGWASAEEAIGKAFNWGLGKEGFVVGVVKDYHHASLQQRVQPIVMHILPDWFGYFSLRINTSQVQETLATLEQTWQQWAPNRPFEYFFMDEDYDRQYRAEQQFGQISSAFSLLAILIACLGLFGLAAYTAEQRTKEIGVRKVLGASVSNLVLLFSKEFTRLVLIAFVIAAPVAYFAMQQWLETFAYRIDLGIGTFLFAGLLALLIAWFTVSFQAIKSALNDPVKALRYE